MTIFATVILGISAAMGSALAGPQEQPELVSQQADAAAAAMHAECSFFGADRERFLAVNHRGESHAGRLTREFMASAPSSLTVRNRAVAFSDAGAGTSSTNLIDKYIWQDLQANNVTPAGKTTDQEFIRRVTLDLTGRIPTPDRVTAFLANTDPDKRNQLVYELLAKPEWVDKWTMYFGDLYKNTASNVQVRIQPEGRNAFYKYIHQSLASGKPYNKIAAEIISAQGNNSFDQSNGQINYFPLGIVTGGPSQDIFDSQAANIADQFLGMAHVNCLLCHSGRGHLDSLSLWGSKVTRSQAWGFASFLSHTWTRSIPTPADPNNPKTNYNYYSLEKYTADYALNTTTGNRPARQPVGALKNVSPTYLDGKQAPAAGEDYRAALAKYVTSDFQFARATVNYMWAQFFGKGLVDPVDQFDPARLDPDNPPPAPWTLQPSNPRLLNALAQEFIDNNYSIQALQRLIVTSDTYQLASEYPGNWDPTWEKYFARHFVRRLWSEELHDSVVTAIQTLPSYTVPGFTLASAVYGVDSPGFGKISYAMQAPDVVNMPDGGSTSSQFLDLFLRGNRDDQPRKSEGSILQTLGLMNDNFIENRIHATGTGATATFLAKLLATPITNDVLVDTLFMNVLSRHPSDAERVAASNQLLLGGAINRKSNAEDVLWTLLNKVDFVFNY